MYAVAARTLATFERALGRRVGWAFPRHQLDLFPHAFAGPNACYVARHGAVFFGYLEGSVGESVYSCLSHDIIVHEVTHAILDGLRPRFIESSLPDQLAFHEAFADIVALLSVFSIPELVEAVLGTPDRQGRIPAENVEEDALAESALFTVAGQFGEAVSRTRGSALRRSLTLEPGEDWEKDPDFERIHRRGEVVVAAILRTLLDIWTSRLRTLTSHGRVDRRRAAEAGAKSAEHLLRMSIRAIDYMPSVDLEFADFLLLVADSIVAPDDRRGYRVSIEGAFRAFGVTPSEPRVVDLAREPPTYLHLNFAALRSDPEEVFRFIWQNADKLRIPRDYSLLVNAVRPSIRVGPDGLVVTEIVVDYVQTLSVSYARAARDLPEARAFGRARRTWRDPPLGRRHPHVRPVRDGQASRTQAPGGLGPAEPPP